ncbi:50S ribosomal protein L23 [Mycoplasma sp. SG1]|uniref:50S ribosomal protein L23 n=1 Tax=Mycoplasma sp. SG1 TaxID=2810348 RepID=UPI0020240E8D|nr:50S ribosomal protein L23 [Mycoplasma sp. SG1]URM52893.1 50S ribosomal protein L23 [Mycoplasma sp. SG1]
MTSAKITPSTDVATTQPKKIKTETVAKKENHEIDYQKFDFSIFSTIKRSWLTEKVYKQINEKNIYVFEVNKNANSSQIKHDFQILFDVDVEKVNVITIKPRKKRLGKYQGFKPGMKKAYIKLAKGQKISVFEEDLKEIQEKEQALEAKKAKDKVIDVKAEESKAVEETETASKKDSKSKIDNHGDQNK